jgi:hypothetical protein
VDSFDTLLSSFERDVKQNCQVKVKSASTLIMVRATTASGRSSNASSNNSSGATMAANAATTSQSLAGGWGNNSKHNSKASAAAAASNSTTGAADPTFLLSRGYTSRFLLGTTIPSHANAGSTNGNSGLTPDEERSHPLRPTRHARPMLMK